MIIPAYRFEAIISMDTSLESALVTDLYDEHGDRVLRVIVGWIDPLQDSTLGCGSGSISRRGSQRSRHG